MIHKLKPKSFKIVLKAENLNIIELPLRRRQNAELINNPAMRVRILEQWLSSLTK